MESVLTKSKSTQLLQSESIITCNICVVFPIFRSFLMFLLKSVSSEISPSPEFVCSALPVMKPPPRTVNVHELHTEISTRIICVSQLIGSLQKCLSSHSGPIFLTVQFIDTMRVLSKTMLLILSDNRVCFIY